MNVGDLDDGEFARRLAGSGLGVRCGALSLRLGSDVPAVADGVRLLYAGYPLVEADGFCDFAIRVGRVGGLRRWLRPQVQFHFDHRPVYQPMPIGHALPLLEWALNWAISRHAHQFLVVHAAAVERDGRAVVMPAPPGSGKSTLCAALVHRGWRLLSDELALISLADGRLHALARPISLKNRSLDVIADFVGAGARFSAASHDTAKGTVGLLQVPAPHIERAGETARGRWVVFPRWSAGAPATLSPRPKPDTMIELGRQAFNYATVVRDGFARLADLVGGADCHDFVYGRLDDAVETFERLAAAPEQPAAA